MTAIGVVETVSIPLGVLAGDQMVKTAQVELVTAQTVCAGKYIVVVSGEVAAVRSAVAAGVESAASALVDSLVIANVDERVVAAMAGACPSRAGAGRGRDGNLLAGQLDQRGRYRRESGGRGIDRSSSRARHGRQIVCHRNRRGRRGGGRRAGGGRKRADAGAHQFQRRDPLAAYGYRPRPDVTAARRSASKNKKAKSRK